MGEDARQRARQGGSGLWGGGHRTAARLQDKAACGPASLRALWGLAPDRVTLWSQPPQSPTSGVITSVHLHSG